MYVWPVVTASLTSECVGKSQESDLLSEPQYFDYYMIIYIFIFMAYAKNIIVQSNFLVKNLLKSYNTLDIWLFLSLQKWLYKAQRTQRTQSWLQKHIPVQMFPADTASTSWWPIYPASSGNRMAQNRSVSKRAFGFLPNTSWHYEPEWPHCSPHPPRRCLLGAPYLNIGEDQHNDLEPELEVCAMPAERADAQAGLCGETWFRENSFMLMPFLFRLLISAAQRNMLCWRSLEVCPVPLCIPPGRGFWPDVLFALLAQMHHSPSLIPWGLALPYHPGWMGVTVMMLPSHYQVLVWGTGASGSSNGGQLSSHTSSCCTRLV